MANGIAIAVAFCAGWWLGGWHTSRYWQKWCSKSLEFADFWQKEFVSLLDKLPKPVAAEPSPPEMERSK